jgi:Uma2 family endonuclease
VGLLSQRRESRVPIIDTERVSEEAYRRLVLEDPSRQWELHQGRLREKPTVGVEHGHVLDQLLAMLYAQLDRRVYRLRPNHARLRRSADSYYVPDVAVIRAAAEDAMRERPTDLDVFTEQLPLVVEIWSPSTGDYDLKEKMGQYRQRGDEEIWRIHPYERTLTVWRRRRDGSYDESTVRDGKVRLASIPEVTIDVDALFA